MSDLSQTNPPTEPSSTDSPPAQTTPPVQQLPAGESTDMATLYQQALVELGQNKNQLATLGSQLTQSQADRDQANQQLTQVQQTATEREGQLTTLNTQLAGVQAEKQTLESQVGDLQPKAQMADLMQTILGDQKYQPILNNGALASKVGSDGQQQPGLLQIFAGLPAEQQQAALDGLLSTTQTAQQAGVQQTREGSTVIPGAGPQGPGPGQMTKTQVITRMTQIGGLKDPALQAEWSTLQQQLIALEQGGNQSN